MFQLIFLAMISLLMAACSHSGKKSVHGDMKPVYYAIAEVRPVGDSKVKGQIVFFEAFGKVKVKGEVSGLRPDFTHGFHIHEFGDCTSKDAKSAGGHYNPGGHKHGGLGQAKRHAGDMGNIETDSKGKAQFEREIDGISVSSGRNPILGRGLIIHAEKDDEVSQPTGGAGARIACGVIGAAKKTTKQ